MEQSPTLSVPDTYHHFYRGETLLLKVSGRGLLHEQFPALIEDVRELVRHAVRFIIVCGAGEQNTQYLREYVERAGREWVEPERVGGRRRTDWEQLEHGVLPAHRAIREMFQGLLPEATVLEPEHIHCRRLHDLGYVGDPEYIENLHAGNIVVVLSVGSDGEHLLNVNADDTARVVTEQESAQLNEAFFVTDAGGVLQGGHVVPFLWEEEIAEDGRHAHIDVTGGSGGMQKKLREAKRMLRWVEKVVITDVQSVRKEIEQVLGSGTMVVSRKSVRCDPLRTEHEEAVFDALYERYVRSGDFRSRTSGELQELKEHVYLLKVSNSILGAFALIPQGRWMELATVCSEYNGARIGDIIVQTAQEETMRQGKDSMYALASSEWAAALFERNHFEHRGRVSELQRGNPCLYDHLPCITEYDLHARAPVDPCVCVWHGKGEGKK